MRNITQYESFGKPELSYYGMASAFAIRNNCAMKPNGLKTARKRIKIGQAEIAERLGVSVPQVSRWENGVDNVPSTRLRSFAKAYEASLGELFGDEPEHNTPEGMIPTVPVPMLGEVPAGNWREVLRMSSRFIPVSAQGVPSSAYALKVDGDSMDKIAKSGATIIVDPTDLDLFDRSLFVVRNSAGETTFKQYLDGPARLVPCSTNPDHKVIPLGSEEISILGRVILITSPPSYAALD